MKRIPLFILCVILLACNNEKNNTFTSSVIVEGTAVKISAQTGGVLLEMRNDEGDEVSAGDTLAIIDTEKLGYQLDQIHANLEDLAVQKIIAATNAQQADDEFNYAQMSYQRILDLYKNNSAPEQKRDDAKINFDRAASRRDQAKQSLQSIKSKRKALEAQAKLLERQIKDATIISPISGTITTKFYEKAETVPTLAPLVEIIDLAKMWTKIYVSETYLSRIQIGQRADIGVDGINKSLEGVVAWISPKAEFTPKNILTDENRTGLVYAIKIIIDNPDRLLKHGMPVKVELQPST